MPPHLHPRSAATSTLFAGTLVASFVVVAVPHIWPCPRPRKAYMDGNSDIVVDEQGRLMRRVRRTKQPAPNDEQLSQDAAVKTLSASSSRHPDIDGNSKFSGTNKRRTLQEEAEMMRALQAEGEALEQENARRECPVPKPKGALGRLLGFDGEAKRGNMDSK